jgi:prolyl-tRNA synthetase
VDPTGGRWRVECQSPFSYRTLAAVIEEHHDAAGIIWPVSLAPFEALVVPVKYEGAAGASFMRFFAVKNIRRSSMYGRYGWNS